MYLKATVTWKLCFSNVSVVFMCFGSPFPQSHPTVKIRRSVLFCVLVFKLSSFSKLVFKV